MAWRDAEAASAALVAGDPRRVRGRLLLQAHQFGKRKQGDPSDRVALLGQSAEAQQALDVEVGIESLAPLGPGGTDDAVAPLPGPEDVGREPGAEGDQPNGVARGGGR